MTKEILIVGASGRVGQRLMHILQENDAYHVVGTSSHPATDSQLVQLDLHGDFEAIHEVIAPFDIVFFTAGSRGKDLLQVDLNGNVKVARAAEQVGVERFIQLSAVNALNQRNWVTPKAGDLTDYHIARYYADQATTQTNLAYTIVQAGSLLENEATHLIQAYPISQTGQRLTMSDGVNQGNTLDDVAQVLAETLHHPNLAQKVIEIENGTESIGDALAQI
ncbi:NAD-dependent epimerase/dehydratase family protein [Weissella viridescens]|uniref:NAD-dependent epimerase/dehydratase family protein n=1 Tax=Weissella viridescens TaxID=1629 RepID=A0A3P2RCI8_WEIVI|nr:NAD(P)H-binding protein [Weissella viridescens]RRG18304.1 NAD-dependent epimerase/dehydratase family protein [Weissella viridescens]